MITKEERFLLILHEKALQEGDVHAYIDPAIIANVMRITPHTAKTMQHILTRANFIKKNSEGFIGITPRGVDLIAILLEKI